MVFSKDEGDIIEGEKLRITTVRIKQEYLALIDMFEAIGNEELRKKYRIIREGGSRESRSAFIRKVINLFDKIKLSGGE